MWFKRYRHWIGVWATMLLGLIFTAAGLGKLVYRPEAFVFAPDFLPPALIKAFLIWLPGVEIIIGVLLITGVAAKFVASFSLVLIAGFIANNSLLLKLGLGDEPCDCFGMAETLAQERLSVIGALYLDVVMLALVVVILFCYQRNFFNIYPWFLKKRQN